FSGVEGSHQRTGCRHPRHEFEQQVLDDVGLDGAERRHVDRQFADLVVIEQSPDLATILLAQRQHQDGGAFRDAQRLALGPFGLLPSIKTGAGSVSAGTTSAARMRLTSGRITMNSTTRPSSIMTPSSMTYMTSSFVNCSIPSRPDGSATGGTDGASAKRRLTTSTWSPRFWSKPIAERTRVAMRSSCSLLRS